MRLIYLFLGLALIIIMAGFVFYVANPARNVVFFDEKKLRGQLIQQLAQSKATEAQVSLVTRKFSTSLNKVLTDYAKQKRVVILDRNTVFAGGIDITDEVANLLSLAMRKKS